VGNDVAMGGTGETLTRVYRNGATVAEVTEIDAFVNHRWLVTVRKDDGFSMAPVLARWDRSIELTRHGVSFLLYGLLDVVVDGYFEAVEAFDDYYDEVSEGIFSEKPLDPAEQRLWFQMRRALVRFHRLVVPLREVVSGLMRREHSVVSGELYPYFQDVYDHVLRVTESTDSLRDLVGTIVETNLSLRDYRQNLIMKKVTSWAAIIAVPTLVTGWYGMNVPFPGSGEPWGVALSGGLVVLASGTLFVLFRRRDWL
jgi:magnesium transporter